MDLPDDSIADLAAWLIDGGSSPSRHVLKLEERDQVRAALRMLKEADREILVMRVLEGLPAKEVGEILGVTEAAVNMRQLRALERIRPVLARLQGDDRS